MTALAIQHERLEVEGLVVDPLARVAWLDGQELALRAREFDLLELLATSPERMFSKPELYEAFYGVDLSRTSRAIDAHACRLRAKLGSRFLVAGRGRGYRLLRVVAR